MDMAFSQTGRPTEHQKYHEFISIVRIHASSNQLKFLTDSTQEYIYKWVEDCIKEGGENQVIQVFTNNHAFDMCAKKTIKMTQPSHSEVVV